MRQEDKNKRLHYEVLRTYYSSLTIKELNVKWGMRDYYKLNENEKEILEDCLNEKLLAYKKYLNNLTKRELYNGWAMRDYLELTDKEEGLLKDCLSMHLPTMKYINVSIAYYESLTKKELYEEWRIKNQLNLTENEKELIRIYLREAIVKDCLLMNKTVSRYEPLTVAYFLSLSRSGLSEMWTRREELKLNENEKEIINDCLMWNVSGTKNKKVSACPTCLWVDCICQDRD